MSAGEPGWYQDPGGQPGVRWWDGSTWSSEVRPPGPTPVTARPSAPGSTEADARNAPPHFDISPDTLFQSPTPPPSRPAPSAPSRSPLLWIGLAVAAVIFVVGIVVISSHSTGVTPNTVADSGSTTSVAPGVTVGPSDSVYTDSGSLYTMATGANWKVGPPGTSNSATWTVSLDPANSAKVQVLPARLDAPQSVANLTQSDAQQLDPKGTRVDPGVLYLVDGTGTDQLADGAPAGLIHLHTNPSHPDNAGADLVGDALVTSKGDLGAMVLVLCPAAAAATCLTALLPYARTIQLTSS